MSLNLVTGHTGETHITSNQVGQFNKGLIGYTQASDGNYAQLLNVGSECEASILSSSVVRFLDGEIICEGRHIQISDYLDVTISGGALNTTKTIYIYLTYSIDSEGIESVDVNTSETAPTNIKNKISDGDTSVDFYFAKATLTDYSVTSVKLLTTSVSSIETIETNVSTNTKKLNKFTSDEVTEFTYASGFTYYDDTHMPKMRAFTFPVGDNKYGYIVNITGVVKNTKDINPTASASYKIGQFGNDSYLLYAPDTTRFFVEQGSGLNRFHLSIGADGVLTMAKYGTDSYATCTSGSWLCIDATYYVIIEM